MKHVAETFFNCAICEDIVEPGDLATHVVGVGPVCDDCAERQDDNYNEHDYGYWEAGDY